MKPVRSAEEVGKICMYNTRNFKKYTNKTVKVKSKK